MKLLSLAFWLIAAATAHAQLAVSVAAPKITGTKTVVKLELNNTFPEKIESARAVCFLVDEQGKVLGQSAQWVIGGTKDKPPLGAGATNTFHFVMATDRATTTNLAARVNFTRLILEGGKLADPAKQVIVTPPPK